MPGLGVGAVIVLLAPVVILGGLALILAVLTFCGEMLAYWRGEDW